MILTEKNYVTYEGEKFELVGFSRVDWTATVISLKGVGLITVDLSEVELTDPPNPDEIFVKPEGTLTIVDLRDLLLKHGAVFKSDCSDADEPYMIFTLCGVRFSIKESTRLNEIYSFQACDSDRKYYETLIKDGTSNKIAEKIKLIVSEDVIPEYTEKFNAMLEGWIRSNVIGHKTHAYYLALDFISDMVDDASSFDQSACDLHLDNEKLMAVAINQTIEQLHEHNLLKMTAEEFNENSCDHLDQVYLNFSSEYFF